MLIPGQFWGIPLLNGTYACGRVIQVHPKGVVGACVMFLAGLLDWNSSNLPTSDSIAGAACIEQGDAHLKTILENGREILGCRPLEKDGIEPWVFRGASFWRNSFVQRGLIDIRPQTPDDDDLPVLHGWGYKVISIRAEDHFG